MKKSRFTENPILAILTEDGFGIPVAEVRRKHGISAPTYYQWKSKYAGMSLPELKRVKELEAEDAWLFDSLTQAQQILEGWRVEYNTVRFHESLDKKTPPAYLPRVVIAEICTFKLSTRRESLHPS